MSKYTLKKFKFKDHILVLREYSREQAKGSVLILHGMAEHGDRYDDFASYINSLGFAVFVPDHRQHGKSVFHDECGIFNESDSYEAMLADIDFIYNHIEDTYEGLPIYIFGHSMGTMLSRGYIQNYEPDVRGVILSGSPVSELRGLGFMKFLSAVIAKFNGGRSRLLSTLTFAGNNKRIANKRTAFDWLSTDEKVVDKYIDDELCGYDYNARFYTELAKMFKDVNDHLSMQAFPDVPVLFVYGSDDPVGEYGDGARALAEKYNAMGKDFRPYIFEGMRHELLNEKGKEEVYKLIGEFLKVEEK